MDGPVEPTRSSADAARRRDANHRFIASGMGGGGRQAERGGPARFPTEPRTAAIGRRTGRQLRPVSQPSGHRVGHQKRSANGGAVPRPSRARRPTTSGGVQRSALVSFLDAKTTLHHSNSPMHQTTEPTHSTQTRTRGRGPPGRRRCGRRPNRSDATATPNETEVRPTTPRQVVAAAAAATNTTPRRSPRARADRLSPEKTQQDPAKPTKLGKTRKNPVNIKEAS